MHRPKRRWLLVVVAAFLPGCPFESKVPLGTPAPREVDVRFTGHWIWEDPAAKAEPVLMSVSPFNGSEYLVTLEEEGKAPGHFRAFQVEVGNQVFWNLNVVATTHPPENFFFTRCSLRESGELALRFVSASGVPRGLASDPVGLMKHIEAHVDDDSLDDKDKGLYLWRRPKAGEVRNGVLSLDRAATSEGAAPRR